MLERASVNFDASVKNILHFPLLCPGDLSSCMSVGKSFPSYFFPAMYLSPLDIDLMKRFLIAHLHRCTFYLNTKYLTLLVAPNGIPGEPECPCLGAVGRDYVG